MTHPLTQLTLIYITIAIANGYTFQQLKTSPKDKTQTRLVALVAGLGWPLVLGVYPGSFGYSLAVQLFANN